MIPENELFGEAVFYYRCSFFTTLLHNIQWRENLSNSTVS